MPADYVCACGKRFRRREHLNRHAQAHHSSSRPHVCGICQRAFARSDVLKRHLTHHQETGSTRLLRASSACDRCHARKERCSGELPCTRCVESGALCQRNRISPPRGGASSSAVQPPSPQGTSFFRDSSSSSSSGSENEAPMAHSPQARRENAVDEGDGSPPPSYTATPSPYMRPQKDSRHFQPQSQQQLVEQHHNQPPSTTVLNLISAAAAYKSIITGLDSTGTNPTTTTTTTGTNTSTPTPTQPLPPPVTTALVPAAPIHTLAAPPIPSPSIYAETHHPYPQAAYPISASPSPTDATPPPLTNLHAPQPLRPLHDIRQLEPPPPAPQPQPQPQPLHPLMHPTTAPHAHAQLTRARLAHARPTTYPTILTPHPFIRALAARLVSAELVSLYFADFHYCWPMLHRGRFLDRLDEQPVELVWSVGLIGSLFLEQVGGGGGAGASPGGTPWGARGSPGSVRGESTAGAGTREDRNRQYQHQHQQSRDRWGGGGGGGRHGRAGGDEGDTFRNAAKEVHEWLLTNLSAHLNQWRAEDSYPGDETSQANFVVAQALLLNIIYGICIDQTSLRLRISSALSTLIEWVREAGLFQRDQILSGHDSSGSGGISSSSSSCSSGIGQGNDTDYERWLELEGKKRLSMSIFRLDTNLSIIHDRAPSIRFQEVRVPLQCTLALWDAYTVDDWRRARLLEPNGRLHKTFSSICATAASANTRGTIPVLLEEDFELGLCAMQARLWEDTQQRHEEFGNSSDQYEYGPPGGGGGGGSGGGGGGGGGGGSRGGIVREGRIVDGQEVGPNDLIAQEFVGFGEGWHAQLEHWRVFRERCQQVNAGYSPPAHWRRTRFNTSMLYFLSYVRMHADVVLIRRLSASLQKERTGRTTPASMSSMTNRRLENRVHAWAGSRNARIALRYAAQMFRLYAEEVDMFASTFQRIDPFSVGCMLRAGLVVWAYTRSNLVCELCSDISPENPEDPGMSSPFFGPRVVCELAEIWGPVDSEYVNYWILNGGRASMNGNLLCACGLPQLIDAFIIVMRRGTAESSFVEPIIRILENLKYCR